jgi:hypothetical protein
MENAARRLRRPPVSMTHLRRFVLLACLIPGTALAQTKSTQDGKLTAEKLFAPGHLVRVDIEIPEKDWDELRSQTRTFGKALTQKAVTSPYKYHKGNVTIDGVRVEGVGIRKKGFIGSLDRHRPSLKIKFGEFKKQNPAVGFDRLTLNNNKQDRSQVSQVLALKLFRDAGSPASRCNFAKVTVNGRPLGIYSNVESIKPPFLKHQFGDSSGNLYEGTVTDFFVDGLVKFQLKTSKTTLGPVKKVAEILAKEEIDLVELSKVLDIDAFLKFWAVESLTGFWDGYTNNQNNFFLYQNPKNSKLYFLPWGVDSAFVATMPLPPYVIKTKAVHSQATLPNLLYQIPAIQKRYRATLEGLLKTVWNEEKLGAELDRMEALVMEHVSDLQRNPAEALKKVRGFIRTRRRIMERSLRKWPVKLTTGPRALMYFEKVGSATAKFSTTYRESSPMNSGKAVMELTLDGKKVTFKSVGVKSERSTWPTIDGGPKPPTIVLTGERASDGKLFFLAVSTAIEEFCPSKGQGVTVQGVLIEGRMGFLNPKGFKMVSGEAKLEVAGMSSGAEVRGEMTVEITTMKGGEAPPLKSR